MQNLNVEEGNFSVSKVLRDIKREKVTSLFLSPGTKMSERVLNGGCRRISARGWYIFNIFPPTIQGAKKICKSNFAYVYPNRPCCPSESGGFLLTGGRGVGG